jgi:hypothetical protein
MPIISQFFGISIYMFWKDHMPPHFHAKYGGEEIIMDIETGNIQGNMTKRAVNLINEWRQIHIEELRNDWNLALKKSALNEIQPLE